MSAFRAWSVWGAGAVLACAVLGGSAGAARAGWALREAARAGDVVRVGQVLAAGEDPSGEADAPTPLMEAAMGGHTRVMDVLARAGADLERRDQNGDRAIHWAIASRQEGAVAWLIAHHADVAARGHGGRTPLLAAVAVSSRPIVERLVAAGASARDRDDTGWGATYMAVIWASADVLAAVLAAGADANDADGVGESALVAAAARDEPQKIVLLLAHGADRGQADAAWLAAARQKARGAMAVLLADARPSGEALVLGAIAGDDAAVARFLSAGVSIEAVAQGKTALGAAAWGGHEALVARLLLLGARREPAGAASPLMLATSQAIAVGLLAGPPLAQVTLDEALFAATADGDVARVRLLLGHGASAAARDAGGRGLMTVLDEAIATCGERLGAARGQRGIPGWVHAVREQRARLEAARPELARLFAATP